MSEKASDQTRALHAGGKARITTRTVGPPIQRGSTVLMPDAASLYDPRQVSYGRSGLQPHSALLEALCDLEGAAGGTLFPSGLAALTGTLLALVSAGDDILVVDSAYSPTKRFCDRVLKRLGVSVRYYDPLLTAGDLANQVTAATRLIVLESPGSLTFEVQDAPAIAGMARARGVLTLLDNTWGAGLFFKPLRHGVDISAQALTKYVGGHSDVFMGCVTAADPALVRRLQEAAVHIGWHVSPEDAWLMLRGLRTLPTRLERHQQNALALAAWLVEQPQTAEVLCPGLPGARGHDLWKRDFTGQNGLVGLVLQPAPETAVHAFLDALGLFGLGFSWGGYESLAIHAGSQLEARTWKPDLAGPLVRLHVGLEDVDDLKADLARGFAAFDKAQKKARPGEPGRA